MSPPVPKVMGKIRTITSIVGVAFYFAVVIVVALKVFYGSLAWGDVSPYVFGAFAGIAFSNMWRDLDKAFERWRKEGD